MRQEKLVILGSRVSEARTYEGLSFVELALQVISYGSNGDMRVLAGSILTDQEEQTNVLLSGFEAEGMEKLLTGFHPNPNRVQMTKDTDSFSTLENLKNIPDPSQGHRIITSLFHVPRTYWIARRMGLVNVSVVSAEEVIYKEVKNRLPQEKAIPLLNALENRLAAQKNFCEREMRQLHEILSSVSEHYINTYNSFLSGNLSLENLFLEFSATAH